MEVFFFYICIYIYKVMKSNGTGVTNNLFHFQTINYTVFFSKKSLSCQMHFPILLCTVLFLSTRNCRMLRSL